MSHILIGATPFGRHIGKSLISKYDEIHVYEPYYKSNVNKLRRENSAALLYTTFNEHHSLQKLVEKSKSPRFVLNTISGDLNVIGDLAKVLSTDDCVIDINGSSNAVKKSSDTCAKAGIEYLDCALFGSNLLISGTQKKYSQQFLDDFFDNCIHLDHTVGNATHVHEVFRGVETAVRQSLADIYTYCDKDPKFMYLVTYDIKENYPIHNHMIEEIGELYRLRDVREVQNKHRTQTNDTLLSCAQSTFKSEPTGTIISASIANQMDSYQKMPACDSAFNERKNDDTRRASNALLFAFSMILLEAEAMLQIWGIDVPLAKQSWHGSIIDCHTLRETSSNLMISVR